MMQPRVDHRSRISLVLPIELIVVAAASAALFVILTVTDDFADGEALPVSLLLVLPGLVFALCALAE